MVKNVHIAILGCLLLLGACKKESAFTVDACIDTQTAWQSDTITINDVIDFSYCGKLPFSEGSFQYNFGDGTVVDSSSASHTYAIAGTYHATLTVTDNNKTATDSVNVTVMPYATIQDYSGNFHAVQTCYGDSVVQSSFNNTIIATPPSTVTINNFSNSGNNVTLSTNGNLVIIPSQPFAAVTISGYGSMRPDYSQVNMTYYLFLNSDTVGVCYQLLKKQ